MSVVAGREKLRTMMVFALSVTIPQSLRLRADEVIE
jgi:hypothetical protein